MNRLKRFFKNEYTQIFILMIVLLFVGSLVSWIAGPIQLERIDSKEAVSVQVIKAIERGCCE